MNPRNSEQPGDLLIELGDRHYRIRGHEARSEGLRINLMCRREGKFHLDVLDLYTARQRTFFVGEAAKKLDVEPHLLAADLDELVLKLEGIRAEQAKSSQEKASPSTTMTEEARKEALSFLRDRNLIRRILTDFECCGVVREQTNKLVGYLAAVSRKLEEPLAVIVQSSSAAGKSSLMEAILALVPPEDRVKYSTMTGQSLFYMTETDLRHKILAVVEEQGAQRASYALKLLQSEGELTIASTGKDPISGKLVTHEYTVEGPVMLFLTTTAIDIDEELLNRCLILTVDETREQTQAIHQKQRHAQTLAGLLVQRNRETIVELHRNAQRLLSPFLVVNPYAEALTFADERTRSRRDHMKYLTLIRSIALLHQHQRPKKKVEHEGKEVEYIEVELSDIALANDLCSKILGRSLDDLPPQTRSLLLLLDKMACTECERIGVSRKDFRFTRRQLRAYTGMGDTQLKIHLARLVELEYLVTHVGAHRQTFHYELAYDGQGQDGAPFMLGLISMDTLRSAPNSHRSAPGRVAVGSGSARSRPTEKRSSNGVSTLPLANLQP